ncbi:hypothetical protein Tco_1164068 [Tanacetum coccineum]
MKQGWCGQEYKDLLWRATSATNVRDFEKCRAKSDLLLNNMCEVFNGKIVGGVIDKCTGSLTPTTTRIMTSIKKEAHFIKVQWNGANKYQVSGSLACWNMGLNDRAAPPLKHRQAQQTEPAVGQDGSGRSGAGAVIVSKTRNADGREMDDGVPTQSSAADGESEWYFL